MFNQLKAIGGLSYATCIIALLVGCGGGGGSSGDSSGEPPPSGNGTSLEPTLASIQSNIFTPVCTQCHAGASAPHGLRLEASVAHSSLVNVPSEQVPSLMRVHPGNADDSYIIHKLEGTNDVGTRMPQGGPYLSQNTINVIRQWIDDGAEDDNNGNGDYGVLAMVNHTWPVDGSVFSTGSGPKNILIGFTQAIPEQFMYTETFTLRILNVPDPSTGLASHVNLPIPQVTWTTPTTVRIPVPENTWQPGAVFELRVAGEGPWALVSESGLTLDGNYDGTPGGDVIAIFTVGYEQ